VVVSMRSAVILRLRLRCDASAPARAREALRAVDRIEPVRDDALLVISELATNAVLHSGCDPNEEIEIVAELVPEGLRIEVADRGHSDQVPMPRGVEFVGPGGMGLHVVQAIARGWGTERGDGTRVWAELAL
jgi:anti-sigma regulatory factor (Ser/Thr protein kinase)